MTRYVQHETLPGTCGVGIVYIFDETREWGENIEKLIPKGGIGLTCAGFIENDKKCDEVFKILEKRAKLVYRSPTRTNRNSGNRFYFAVFDFKESAKSKYGFYDSGDTYYKRQDQNDKDEE